MKIGILGGTFDPIHYAHLRMAEVAIEEVGLDKVIFMPNGGPPDKTIATTATDRLNMCYEAVEGLHDKRFVVSDIEINSGGLSYTVNTLKKLHEDYPLDEFFLIIGSDRAFNFYKWKDSEKILDLTTIVIIQRDGDIIKPNIVAKCFESSYLVNSTALSISSTAIRRYAAAGKSIRFLTPDSVITYIKDNGLYEL